MDLSQFGLAHLIWPLVLTFFAATNAEGKSHSITVRGHVVDDETGKPVPRFVQQSGYSAATNPEKIVWGGGLSTTDSPRNDGAFNDNLGWEDGQKAWSRIIADDYLPQPIRDTPFSTMQGRRWLVPASFCTEPIHSPSPTARPKTLSDPTRREVCRRA